MPGGEPARNAAEQADPVVSGVLQKIRSDFPWASETAVASHLTLLRATAVYSETLDRLYGRLGLSRARFNLLWVLYRSSTGRLSIGELSDNTGVTAPSVMKMTQWLEAEGWVRTLKGSTDRRVTFVEMTEDGAERFAGLLQEALRFWDEVWSGLTPEETASLTSALAKLRQRLLLNYLGETGLAAFRARHHSPPDAAD